MVDDWLRFERLLADMSARFVGLAAHEVDGEIDRALEALVEFLDVERSLLIDISPDGTTAGVTHSWARRGGPPYPKRLVVQDFPWFFNRIVQGDVIAYERLPDDLPPEAVAEREYVAAAGMRSQLTIPLKIGGAFVCAVAFGAFRACRAWPADLVARLRLAGEVLANALHRKRAEEALRAAEATNRAVLASLSSQVAVLDRLGGIVAVNDAWRRWAGEVSGDLELGVGADYRDVCQQLWPEAAAKALDGLDSVLARGLDRWEIEYEYVIPAGSRWFLTSVTPLRHPGGGAVVSHTDVTELERTKAALRESLAEVHRLKERIEAENTYLREEIQEAHGFDEIVGTSGSLRKALGRVEQVAATDATVLLLGETGTGKEMVAHAIHSRSRRRDRTLVKVNCAALPPTLVEAELFGHEKGAFTGATAPRAGRFEVADGGTLFLDEIGDLALELQAKLLRVLQAGEFERVGSTRTRKVDVRIVAATNQDLEQAIGGGRFRSDLYYRLNVFPIKLPPLRERREDVPLLVWAVITRRQDALGRRIEKVPARVMQALQAYAWPGNVRELENVVERALILSTGPALQLDDSFGPAATAPGAAHESPGPRRLDAVERTHILEVLEECRWRINGPGNAAERLGLHPNTLRFRMKKLAIARPGRRGDGPGAAGRSAS